MGVPLLPAQRLTALHANVAITAKRAWDTPWRCGNDQGAAKEIRGDGHGGHHFAAAVVLGAINVVNSVLVSGEIERTLELIWQSEGGGDASFSPPDPAPRGPEEGPKNAHDTVLSSNYFLVRYDRGGHCGQGGREPHLRRHGGGGPGAGRPGLRRGAEEGRSPGFGTCGGKRPRAAASQWCFWDTSEEMFSYIRVLLLSAAAGLGCWGLMLVFVILLSRRAIRPIAENIERQKQFVTNAGHEIKTPWPSSSPTPRLWSSTGGEQVEPQHQGADPAPERADAGPAHPGPDGRGGPRWHRRRPSPQRAGGTGPGALPAAHGGPGHRLGAGHSAGVSLTADPAQLEQLLSLLLTTP